MEKNLVKTLRQAQVRCGVSSSPLHHSYNSNAIDALGRNWHMIFQFVTFNPPTVSFSVSFSIESHCILWAFSSNLEIAFVISSFSQCGPSHPSVTLGEAWKVASALRLTRRLQLLKKAIYPAGVRKYMHGLKLITWSSQFLIQVLHKRAQSEKSKMFKKGQRGKK